MKFTVSRLALIATLQKVKPAVCRKAALKITENVMIEAKDGVLKITATNIEIAISTVISRDHVLIGEEGATTLPAARLLNLLKSIPGERVAIETNDSVSEMAQINSDGITAALLTTPAEGFPKPPTLDEAPSFTVSQSVFKKALKQVSSAVSTDETRRIITGTLLELNGATVDVVATDGRRLHTTSCDTLSPAPQGENVVITGQTVRLLMPLLKTDGAMMAVKKSTPWVIFSSSDFTLSAKTIEGVYPNYKQVIPTESADYSGMIPREAFLAAISRATAIGCNSLKINFHDNQLTITSEVDAGEAKVVESVPIAYTGNEFSTLLNRQFILDVIRAIPDADIAFAGRDGRQPIVFNPAAGGSYVLMPLRVSGYSG